MKLLRRASLRYHARHPAQLALSVLGVALGVAVVVAIDLAIQSSREAFKISAETVAGRATHTVVGGVGGLDDGLIRRLRLEVGVRAAAPVVEGVASSPTLPGMALRILGVDPFSEGPFRPFVVGGAAGLDVSSFITTSGGVVLSAPTAEEAGTALGDTLPLLVDGRMWRLPVVGLLEPSERLDRVGLRDLLLMDVSSAQEVLGRQGRLSRIDLRIPEDLQGGVLEESVRAALPAGARLEPAGTRTAALGGMIAAFDLNLTALSLLALVFGMFLIYNAMTFSVVQRRELLGSLRALGVTRREVVQGILAEAFAIGIMGAFGGVLLGVVLGRGLVRMVTRTINDLYFVVSVEGLSVPVDVLAKGAVLGLGATMLASLAPALEAASAPPRVAQIRSAVEDSARRAVPRAALAGGVLCSVGALLLAVPARSVGLSFAGLLPVMLGMALLTPLGTVGLVGLARPVLARGAGILGTMASRGVVTAMSRTAPAVAALVVAVSVTVGLGVMIQSFRSTLSRWLGGTLQADVYVSLPSVQASRAEGTLDPAVLASLTGHPEVDGWSTYRGVELDLPEGRFRLVALALDPRGEASFDFQSGGGSDAFLSFREEGAVLVSEPFAYRRGLEVGDSVTLPVARGGGRFPVAGIFYDYGSDQGVVMMSRRTFDHAFDDEGVTSLGLFLKAGSDPEAVVRELTARAPPGQTLVVRTNAALREGSLEVFDRTFQVTAVLRFLAFVVAFVGVLSALMALQLERARELGVLRANGLTPGQVWKLVTTQTGLMGVVAGILAAPMGLVLAAVMIYVVNKRSFGWTLRMEVGPSVILEALILATVGATLAGLYPAWRMSRTSPAQALRGE
ncbi:MAG TPA: FtsX-like permease family protein [Longimicrobiales bacterium]|nr:FtsX-like permease family protein [Longimicrobiales bacterium]